MTDCQHGTCRLVRRPSLHYRGEYRRSICWRLLTFWLLSGSTRPVDIRTIIPFAFYPVAGRRRALLAQLTLIAHGLLAGRCMAYSDASELGIPTETSR